MAEYTKASLKTKINADLADNSEGDISAQDVRENMINIKIKREIPKNEKNRFVKLK